MFCTNHYPLANYDLPTTHNNHPLHEQTLPLVMLAAIAGKSARHTSSLFRFLGARDGALYEIQYGILLGRMEPNFQMGIGSIHLI